MKMGKYIPWQFGYGRDIDKLDSEYMDAINSGDMSKAKDLVEQVAMIEGFNPMTRYHQTNKKFTRFNNDNPVAGLYDSETPNGYFFKDNDHDILVGGETAASGGNIQMRAYLKTNNMLHFRNRQEANAWYCEHIDGYKAIQDEWNSVYENEFEPKFKAIEAEQFNYNTTDERQDELEAEESALIAELGKVENVYRKQMRDLLNDYFLKNNSGYDGIELDYDGHRWVNGKRENVHTYIVFNPEQIKSADPVTYDDDGNVIPLSERFNSATDDIRYSLDIDSDGNDLTDNQTEYFKDSQIRDEDGRLKVMYHGTNTANFTVFDPRYSDDKSSLFFSDNSRVSESYGVDKEKVNPYNLDNLPQDMFEFGDMIGKYGYTYITDGNRIVIKDSDGNEAMRGRDYKSLYRRWYYTKVPTLEKRHGGIYEVYLNIKNPLVVDGRGKRWDKLYYITPDLKRLKTTREISAYAKENGYDGVYFKNIIDMGGYAEEEIPSNVAIAFNSNQVKSIYNDNPTTSDDIRYSLDIDADGESLSDGQIEYFGNSEIRDSGGRLIPVYHGTTNDFNIFDTSLEGGKNGTAEGYGIYLTDNPEIPKSYGNRIIKAYANVTNPAKADQKNIKLTSLTKLIKATIQREAQQYVDNGDYDNVADAMRDTWISNYVYTYDSPIDASVKEVAKSIISMSDSDFDIVREVMSGLAIRNYKQAYDFYDVLQDTLGIDGFVTEWEDSNTGIKSQIILAINSNQVKNVDNLNPTMSEDIRYSLEIDDDPFINFDEYAEYEDNSIDILEEGMNALKDKEVDVEKLRGLAIKLRKEFGSTYDIEDFTDKLTKAFAYMQTNDHVDYRTMMGIFDSIARPVIDQATEQVGAAEYKDFLKSMKGYKIKLTDTQMAEVKSVFGSYGAFTRAMMPLTISKNGTSTLDTIWGELNDRYPDLFENGLSEADLPLRFYDAVMAMRPTPANIYGADSKEVAHDLAMRIVEEYVGKDASKKMHEQITKYRDALKAEKQKRVEEIKKRDTLRGAIKRKNEEIEAQHQLAMRYRDKAQRAKERQMASQQKYTIQGLANKMYKWIANPTEENHVPSSMVAPMLEFLSALDFVTPEIEINAKGLYEAKVYAGVSVDGRPQWETFTSENPADVREQINSFFAQNTGSVNVRRWTDKMNAIRDLFKKAKDHEEFGDYAMDNLLQNLDPEIGDVLEELMSRNKDLEINNLSYKDLLALSNVMRGLMHAIRVGNKAYTQKASIEDWARRTIDNSKKIRTKEHTRLVNNLLKNVVVDMSSPETFFSLQGEAGDEIFTSLEKGFDTKLKDIQKTQSFMEKMLEGVSSKIMKAIHGKDATLYTFDVSEGKIEFTKSQIMSLYELNKREQATLHYAGGIKADAVYRKKMGIRRQVNQTDPIHLTVTDINRIIDTLTDDEKRMADEMQQFMATECASWGNEASELMYGYQKFTDPNYFPISTDANTHAMTNANTNVDAINGIERMGMTKAVNKYADNAIVIRDIFDVFVEHTTNMATYHGLAPAIKDSNRWFNYKFKEDIGNGFNTRTTVKQAVNTNMGRTDQAGANYYVKFVQDMNRKEKSTDITLAGFDELLGTAKGVAIGANLRVVAQQPTAIVRAINEIDAKYIIASLPKAGKAIVPNSKEMERIKQASPLAWYKSMGYYEASMGKSMDTIITGVESARDKLVDMSMSLAGKADDVTWSVLYNAVEKEQRDLLKGQKVTAEEFREKVNERFNRIIARTQVVDATLQKPQWLRASGTFTKIKSAFMAEPMKSYNMLLKSVILDSREPGFAMKRSTKALAVLALTSAFNGFAKSIIDAMRHRSDDDDEYWESVLEYFKSQWWTDMNPLSWIPGLDDYVSTFANTLSDDKSYSSSDDMVSQSLTSIGNALKATIDLAQGKELKTNGYGTLMIYAKALSLLSGVPLANALRDTTAVYNTIVDREHQITAKVMKPNDYVNNIKADIEEGASADEIREDIAIAVENGVSVKDTDTKLTAYYKKKYKEADAEGDEEAKANIESMLGSYFKDVKGMTDEEIDAMYSGWLSRQPTISDADDSITTGEGIEEAAQAVLDFKGADKAIEIYSHWIDEFGDTIELERSQNLGTSYEENLNKAIQVIDPTMDYDSVVEMVEEDKAQKQSKKEADAVKKEHKEALFTAMHNSDGASARQAIQAMGEGYTDDKGKVDKAKANKGIKSIVSNQSHDEWKKPKAIE